MKLLTKKQRESYKIIQSCNICTEKFENKNVKDKKYHKVRDHCHYTGKYRDAVHSISNLKYIVPKNVCNDYHFIIKKLAEQFEKQLTFLTENIARIDKNAEEIAKKIS